MKRNKIILPSLISLLAMGGIALAQDTGNYEDSPSIQAQRRGSQELGRQGQQGPQRQGRPEKSAKAGQRLAKKLNLDQDQQELFEQGQSQMKKKGKRLHKKMKSLVQAREQAMTDGDYDTLHDLIDQQATLKSQMAHTRLNAMEPFSESLSPQQRLQFQEMIKKRHQARRGRRGGQGRRSGQGRRGGQGPKKGDSNSQWEE